MVVTLTCANCQRQETHDHMRDFEGWYEVREIGKGATRAVVCSLRCLGWWGQRQEGWRQHAELEAKRAQEAAV